MLESTISSALRIVLLPAAVLAPAGTWQWWEAWALCGVYVVYAVAIWGWLARHDPALLQERKKSSPIQPGQPIWDQVLMIGMLVAGIAMLVVPGLDVVRYGWTSALPVPLEVAALAVSVAGLVFVGWVMHTNTFLARVVKIDEARGHQVITTGPYAVVRHPMYLAVCGLVFAFPVALGSRWGLIPGGVMGAMLVIRTALEDRQLHQELQGYTAYAKQTRYRLIPGLW